MIIHERPGTPDRSLTAPKLDQAKLRGGWLHVPAPAGAQQTAHVRGTLVSWFRRHAAERLPERVEVWRAKVGVAKPSGRR